MIHRQQHFIQKAYVSTGLAQIHSE